MSQQVFFGLVVTMLLAGLVYAFDEELIGFFTDSDRHVEFAENAGITKAGRPRPGD